MNEGIDDRWREVLFVVFFLSWGYYLEGGRPDQANSVKNEEIGLFIGPFVIILALKSCRKMIFCQAQNTKIIALNE